MSQRRAFPPRQRAPRRGLLPSALRILPLLPLLLLAACAEPPPAASGPAAPSAAEAPADEAAACRAAPDPDRMCPQHYEPVCGCDGRTYGNACMAHAAGIRRFTPGSCSDGHAPEA